MLKISELAQNLAKATATWQGFEVEFTFRPGAYTLDFANGAPVVDVVAACVTEWNIEGIEPTDKVETKKLPWGLMLAVFREMSRLATQEDAKGEDDASSDAG